MDQFDISDNILAIFSLFDLRDLITLIGH